jgi:60 kDa SS-A/Ro ribonucleoprotein
LSDREAIKAARLHPLNVLIAQRQYQQGKGDRGKLTWNPVPQIVDALEDAFYLGFDAIEPTGKNFYLGVDVSGSMSWCQCAGAPITCCEAAAVMAMLAVRTEPNTYVMGFCHSIVDLGITAKDTLKAAADKAQKRNFGGTDCAAAMRNALQRKLDVDVFCIYTDGQTWAGSQHVFQALQEYRQQSGRPAKLAAFQLEGNAFSIADPSDAGMMDFAGFDTAVPPILADFVLQ